MKKKENNKNNQMYLGIDLGTTNTQAAVVDSSGTIQILPNLDGDLVTPSFVSVADKTPTVGKIARQDLFLNPDKVAQQFKKSMSHLAKTGDLLPIVTASEGTEFDAVMLSAEVLSYVKKSAEKLMGCEFTRVVVSVPAYFERHSRKNTKRAGLIAGFTEVHIVDEPTAGATFYGLSKGKSQKIAVFDFGGGTFDISILDITSDGVIDPVSVDGNPECGGANIDEVVFAEARKYVESKGGKLDHENDLAERIEILDSCKEAKESLSRKDTAIIPLKIGTERFTMEISYKQLKQWSSRTIQTIADCCKRALQKANLKPSDIEKVVLIGGSTRLRFVPEIVKDIFGQEPFTDTDPDMAVAKGNAILAAAYFSESDRELTVGGQHYLPSAIKPGQIAGRDLCVAAVTEKSRGNEDLYNIPIIPSKSKLPYEVIKCFTPMDSSTSIVEVKLMDGSPQERSSNSTVLQVAKVSVQPTTEEKNRDRIEFKVKMDIEGMVDIKVRDKILNKSVPIKFKFDTELSEADIKKQRKQLIARHKNN